MRTVLAVLVLTLALPATAVGQTDRPQLSSSWRSQAEIGPDNPTGDPGFVLRAGGYLDAATWRALDEHTQSYHFGLWTAEEVAALELMSGVQLAVMSPVPGTDELGVVQWPDRVNRGGVFLVAVADAEPATDWVFRPVGDVAEAGMPPVDGPASATVTPTSSGFYRVHRLVGADAFRGRRALFRAERVEVNPLRLQTELALTSDSVRLEPSVGSNSGPIVLVAGTYTVRDDEGPLTAPVVVNLSLQGPSADLFTLEVLPAAGEPALTSARDVRVSDRVVFRVLASPAMGRAGSFVDRALPPGGSLLLEVQAEMVSFANEGAEIDFGLSATGFSVAPGVPVVFSPARQAPADVVQRRAPLEIWRPMPVPTQPEE